MFLQAAGGATLELAVSPARLAALSEQFGACAVRCVEASSADLAELPMEPGVAGIDGRMRSFERPWRVYVFGLEAHDGHTPSPDWNHGKMWGTAVDQTTATVRYWAMWW